MPLIAAAGIPWLAGVLGGVFSGLFGFLTKYLTKRLAIVTAVVAVIVTLTAALFAALEGLLAGLSYVFPPEVSQGMALVTPDNLTACVSIIISAKTLRFAYDWNIRVMQYKLNF